MKSRKKFSAGKALLSLLAGACFSPLASAQTANVTLYGLLNMDMEMVSGSTSSGLDTNRVTSWGGSQLGFRGSESLGGGLKAIFQIESGILGDTGGTTLAGRPTFLGLQGDWGTVKLGRMFPVYDDMFPLFADNTFRNATITSSTLWAQGGVSSSNGSFDDTLSNAVRYETPVMNGFRGSVQYATAENTTHAYNLGASAIYENSGLQIGAALAYNDEFRQVGSKDWAATVVVGYNFGFVKLAGVYEYMEYELNNGEDKLKRDMYGLAVTVPVGKASIFGYYGYAGKGRGTGSVGDLRAGDDTGAQQYTLAFSYPLSKRTTVYTGYMYLANDDRANYTYFRDGNRSVGFGPSSVTLGTDQQSLVVGMAHLF